MNQPIVNPGQVWRENDPRLTRHVVTLIGPYCDKDDKERMVVRCLETGRRSYPLASRFNGKRMGYVYVREATKEDSKCPTTR